MRFTSRVQRIVLSLVAAVTLIGLPLTVNAGYSPANRQTYQCITPTNCPGADHVVFNSFTNAPNYGDERAFFDGKDAKDTSANGYLDRITVRDGQLLTLRVYIHNNANPNAIGVAAATARNTRMNVLLPSNTKTSSFAATTISADNASPVTISDTVDFNGARPFKVTFDKSHPVQVTYRPNGTGNFVTNNLPSAQFVGDNIVRANFGDWKGCFEYAALVTMTVKVQMEDTPPPVSYTCDLLDLTVGDNRTVKLTEFDTSTTGGATFNRAVIDWGDNSTPLTTDTVVGKTHKYAKDGTYTVTATPHFTVNGEDVTATSAACSKKVTFESGKPPKVTHKPPTQLVNAGPGEVAGLFAGVTGAGAAAYNWVLRRRVNR
jgi:hypothetical protein